MNVWLALAALLIALAPPAPPEARLYRFEGERAFLLLPPPAGALDVCRVKQVSVGEQMIAVVGGMVTHRPTDVPCARRHFVDPGGMLPIWFPRLAAGPTFPVSYRLETAGALYSELSATLVERAVGPLETSAKKLEASAVAVAGGFRYELSNRSARPVLVGELGNGYWAGGRCGAPDALLLPGESLVQIDLSSVARAEPLHVTLFERPGKCSSVKLLPK